MASPLEILPGYGHFVGFHVWPICSQSVDLWSCPLPACRPESWMLEDLQSKSESTQHPANFFLLCRFCILTCQSTSLCVGFFLPVFSWMPHEKICHCQIESSSRKGILPVLSLSPRTLNYCCYSRCHFKKLRGLPTAPNGMKCCFGVSEWVGWRLREGKENPKLLLSCPYKSNTD